MLKFVSNALLSLVMEKKAREKLEERRAAQKASAGEEQTAAPGANPKRETTPERQELIRNALAIQRAKRTVYQGLEWNLDETLHNIGPIVDELNHTGDHKEGARAFVEKREPVFRGE